MAMKKRKTIKSRNEKISSGRSESKSKSSRQKLERDAVRATNKAIGVSTGKAGTSFKPFRSIKAAANAVRIKKAKRKAEILSKKKAPTPSLAEKGTAGVARMKKAFSGNRATTKPGLSAEQKALRDKMGREFSPEAIAKRTAKMRRDREVKLARQKMTAKRKAQQKRMDKKK